MSARILVVDDHEVLREGMKSLLAKARPEWQVCGEATDGAQAVELVNGLQPDIVILDISMPVMSGLEAASLMRKKGINTPFLIFTTHDSERLEAEVRKVGAQGYVLKSQAARNLVLAIDALLSGGTFFGPPKKSVDTKEKPNSGMVFCHGLAFAF
ncbi:MAG: response regulator [Candidatus Acidiferrales bacterium]